MDSKLPLLLKCIYDKAELDGGSLEIAPSSFVWVGWGLGGEVQVLPMDMGAEDSDGESPETILSSFVWVGWGLGGGVQVLPMDMGEKDPDGESPEACPFFDGIASVFFDRD